MKSFFDHQDLMENTYKKIISAVSDMFPFVGAQNVLKLNRIWVDDKNYSPSDISRQQSALKSHKSWEVPVYADVSLFTKEGKLIDRAQKIRLLSIPFITNRYSYIVDGSEYQVPTQMRLKPGIYSHERGDGLYRGWFNLAKGIDREFSVYLNPSTRKFSLAVGTSKSISLYSVLRDLGISDEDMRKAWGEEIFNKNKKYVPQVLNTVYKAIFRAEPSNNYNDTKSAILGIFKDSTMDPEVNEMTLGRKISHIDPQVILETSKKTLDVARGTQKQDDRDSLVYKNVMSTDDFLQKRIRDSIQRITRKINNNINRKDKVKDILSYDIFNIPIKSFFKSTSLSNVAEHPSLLGYLSEQSKITPLGEGGIENIYQITDSARAINPSHFGFIDPAYTPDNDRAGVILHLSMLAGKEGNDLKIPVYDLEKKTRVTITPKQSMSSIVAFASQFNQNKDGSFTPKQSKIEAIDKGEMNTVPAKDVRYVFLKDSLLFALDTNLIPFLQHNQGNRVLLSTKMLHAATALKDPEHPKVMSEMVNGNTFEKWIGALTNHFSPVEGVVSDISADGVRIKDKKGHIHKVDFYKNFPIGESSFINSRPTVKIGDKVSPNTLVGVTNYSDNQGNYTYGKNLKVGYLSYKGYNTDDGIVVSESAAKKLTSEHVYKVHLRLDENIDLNLKKFRAIYPTAMTEEQASKLDEHGIVKKGTILNPNDTVMAVLRKESLTAEDIILKKLYKKIAIPFKDRSKKWDKDVQGKVIDVTKQGKIVDVFVKTEEPLMVGDKLCVDELTEVLTKNGWKFFKDVVKEDYICVLTTDGYISYEQPTNLYSYDVEEDLYKIYNQNIDLVVTKNHKMYVTYGEKKKDREYSLIKASSLFGKRVRYKKGGNWLGKDRDNITIGDKVYNLDDYLELLGWFISEGNVGYTTNRANKTSYRVMIHQSKKANELKYKNIQSLLDRLDLYYCADKEKFTIFSKDLYEHFKPLGKSYEKYIFDWVLELPSTRLIKMFNSLIAGDGHINKKNCMSYVTTSEKLAGQMQELALKLGWAANIYDKIPPDNLWICGRKVKSVKKCYTVSIITKKLEPQVNHKHVCNQKIQIEEYIHYKGKVYCCEVPSHIMYVRRNGKTVWTGNSNRYGGKGIVTQIIPNSEMPRTKDGDALEVLYSPAVITTRMNVGQILETAASKIANKNRKPYLVKNFDESEKSYLDRIKKELSDLGISDTEKLFDPHTEKELGEILAGEQYMLKLKQQVTTKTAARGGGTEAYSINRAPKGGGPEGGQAIGHLGLYAVLAHGAPANLLELNTYKADFNPEVWEAVRLGQPLPPPKTPFAYEKFMGYLKALGLDTERVGFNINLMPMTDDAVKKLSNGAIDATKIIRGRDLKPERNGLFDEEKTGGGMGSKWTHINLDNEIPNPIFEDAIISITGIDGDTFKNLIAGKMGVDVTGKISEDGNYKFGKAFEILLNKVDVKKELQNEKNKLSSLSGADLARARKKYKILRALDKLSISPAKAYIRKTVPVLPPYFRPIVQLDNGSISTDDMNGLYKNIAIMNKTYKEAKEILPEKEVAEAYENLYDSVKSLELTGARIGGKEYKSVMDIIRGNSPKEGYFQKALINRRKQEVSGRGVIIPDPKLNLDELGIPEKMAWKTYEPFIIRRLVRHGYKPNAAMKLLEERHPFAKKALELEMEERKVFLKRDPVLHKHGVMALKPKLVDGYALKTHPILNSGYGFDYDGDQMSVFVPLSPQAVSEMESMLPSNNIFSPTDGKVIYYPRQEAQLGLYLMTTPAKKTKLKFSSLDDAVKEFKNKKIRINDEISIGGKKQTLGLALINKELPADLRTDNPLDKKEFFKMVVGLAKKYPKSYAKIIDILKEYGFNSSYETGFSLRLNDFSPAAQKEIDKLWEKAEKQVFGKNLSEQEVVKIFTKAKHEADELVEKSLEGSTNSLYTMVQSGAKGKMLNLNQIIGSVGLVEDLNGRINPYPIKNNFAKGLTMPEYLTSMHGARKGSAEKVKEVKDPGYLSKQAVNNVLDLRVVTHDCGTKRGINMSVDDLEVLDRYTSQPIKVGGDSIKHNTLVTPELLIALRNHKISHIVVRSPIRCEAPQGVCQMCMGLNEKGQLPPLGDYVGIKATQSIGEPAVQLTLSSWHKGGVIEKTVSPITRLHQLLQFPKNIKYKATLSAKTGTVDSISPASIGGYDVTIDGVKHWVQRGLSLNVKEGSKVKKGQAISSGIIDPRELLKLRGIEATQNYITDELYDVLKDQGPVKRKNLELVVRAIAGLGEITDGGGHSEYIKGDVAPISKIKYFNKYDRHKTLPLKKAVGLPLAMSTSGIPAGEVLTQEMIQKIKFPSEVEVSLPPIEYNPIIRGINVAPLEVIEDWMAKLNFNHIQQSLTESAMFGGTSNLHGLNPIPGIVEGTEILKAHDELVNKDNN